MSTLPIDPATPARFGAGHTVRRIEDPALVQGRGQFTDDVTLPGQTHLVFVRSDRAHARIVAIDTSAALAVPGVLAVFTGAELAGQGVKPIGVAIPYKQPGGGAFTVPPRRALAHEVVRFVGETVTAVVADTRDAAQAGANAVLVDYDELPCQSPTRCARSRPTRRWCGPTRRATSPPSRGMATLRPPRRRSTALRTASRWTSSTSGWHRARWSRAACWPGWTASA